MPEVPGSRILTPAGTSGSRGSVGYRLRQVTDPIRTGNAFARTLTLLTVMAILETCILCPLENTCSAG
jgi:NitT/TauT family transport system permease protein